MPFKEFALADNLSVKIYKRKTSRSLRLSIAANGEVRVSIPPWVPYATGLAFVRSKASWIAAKRQMPTLLKADQAIGKAHHLHFVLNASLDKPVGKLKAIEVEISYPPNLSMQSPSVQALARRYCIRALRSQAEALLPQRIASLASKHQLNYHSISIKQLKSRWGSCDNKKNIVLNLFLMKLPWECIDYVIIHELTHTEYLEHGPNFWRAMEAYFPEAKSVRKVLRSYQPTL